MRRRERRVIPVHLVLQRDDIDEIVAHREVRNVARDVDRTADDDHRGDGDVERDTERIAEDRRPTEPALSDHDRRQAPDHEEVE